MVTYVLVLFLTSGFATQISGYPTRDECVAAGRVVVSSGSRACLDRGEVMAGLSAVILAVVVGGVYYAMWRQVFANRGPNRNFAGWGGQAYSNMLKVVDVVTCIDLPERGTGLISFHCLARPEPGG
jgi:hypothetical protein